MLRKFPTYTDSEVDLFVESTILRLLKGSRWETVATTSDFLLLLLLISRFASYILSLHPNDDDRTSFFEAFKHFLSSLNDVAVCGGCWSARFECPKMFAFGGNTLIKIKKFKGQYYQSTVLKNLDGIFCAFRKWRNST